MNKALAWLGDLCHRLVWLCFWGQWFLGVYYDVAKDDILTAMGSYVNAILCGMVLVLMREPTRIHHDDR